MRQCADDSGQELNRGNSVELAISQHSMSVHLPLLARGEWWGEWWGGITQGRLLITCMKQTGHVPKINIDS